MSQVAKPKVTAKIGEGGGVPCGFEKRQTFHVYAKPSEKDHAIQKIPSKLQGVWGQSFNAVNPVELWAFNKGDEPDSLRKAGHPTGSWGYKAGTNPKSCAVEDCIFLPPNVKLPKWFNAKGIWCFPVMRRDEHALNEREAGFLHVGTATKSEDMDVAGRWRLLYHRPGEDKPPSPPPPPKDMKIHVKKINGEKITVNVKPDDTINDVKDKVRDKSGIPKDEQRLRHRGNRLEDKPTLQDYGIEDGDILNLEPMEIYIKDITKDKKYTLVVEPTDTIDQIKSRLEKQEDIPKERQRLTFSGKPCQDKKNLRDQGIVHQSVLNLEPMIIYVKDTKSKKYTLENVNPDDTIEQIKTRLESQEGILKATQLLSFNGTPCFDHKSLDDHGIKHQSVLHLEPMVVHVRTPQGKMLSFDVAPTDTIHDMKERVKRKENIPVDEQHMLFGKNSLTNDKATLDSEGIKHNDTIDMEPMHIIIKDWNGKKFRVYCDPNTSIDSIKDTIEKLEGHPKAVQYLTRGGVHLENPQSLQDYRIKHKDVVNLDKMKVFVRDWKGKTFTLEVNPKEKIDDVKQMIEEREGHPVREQILKFKATTLDDPKNLDDYGIKYKDTIDLSKAMPVLPPTPPQKTYVVHLSPYKSPLEAGYTPTTSKKRDGVRANTKEQLKARWHTDLASEMEELGRLAAQKHMKEKQGHS